MINKDDKIIDVTECHLDGTQTTRSLTAEEWFDEEASRHGVVDAQFFDGEEQLHRKIYSYGYKQDHLIDHAIEEKLFELRVKKGPQVKVVKTYGLPYGKEEI